MAHLQTIYDNSRTPGFSLALCREFSHLSQLAYWSERDIQSLMSIEPLCRSAVMIDRDDAQCLAVQLPNCSLLAFRGTELNIVDWLRNLDYRKEPWRVGHIHRGFGHEWNLLADDIRGWLVDNNAGPVFLMGHSKGGAEAQAGVHDVSQWGYSIGGIYTFGSPRLFSSPAQQWYDSKFGLRSWRVKHSNDIVCHTPPCWRDYVHAGQFVYLGEDGGVTLHLKGWAKWRRQLRSYRADAVEDHFIEGYCEALDNSLE